MAYVDGMNDDVVWCAESMTDPSPCSSLAALLSATTLVVAMCVMHAPDHVHTQRSQGSSPPPPHIVMTSCHDHVHTQRDQGSSAFALRAQASEQSDTLETRTKLTSHSALELGGLPRLPTPTLLQRSQRRPQV